MNQVVNIFQAGYPKSLYEGISSFISSSKQLIPHPAQAKTLVSRTCSAALKALEFLPTPSGIYNFFVFAGRWIVHPAEVGTPFASSYAVANEILKFIAEPSDEKHRYLEVGPGPESFIAMKAGPNDVVDLVESDPKFCEMLKKKYKGKPHISIHHMPVQNWSPEKPYDVVAGFVPLNALRRKEIAQEVLDSYARLTKKEGDLLVIGYKGTSALRSLTLFGEAKKSFQEVLALQSAFFTRYQGVVANVWRNFPPAQVTHCKMSS